MYNTGNAVPSDKLEDMSDNGKVLDILVTQTEGTTTDRLGNTRRVFQQILMDMGFQPLSGSFQTGATITARNQTLYDEVSHVFYAWGGALPKVVGAGSTPATSGGIGAGLWSDKTDLKLRGELAAPDGAKLVGMCSSISEMLGVTPAFDGQRINVLGYYADTPLIGGGSFIGYADTTSVHNGFTIFRVNANYIWKRWKDNINLYDGGARQDVADNSDVLERAMLMPRTPIQVLPGYYHFQYGVTVPPNHGLCLYAFVSHKGSAVFVYSPAVDDTATALIKFAGDAQTLTHSGATLKNITLVGIGNPERHGIEAHFVGHPEFYGVRVEGFKGSGILLDKCQDGILDFIEIQNCGRTSGDYRSIDDCKNNNLTTFAPLQIYTSVAGDASNMLRIKNIQIEANKVSPSIRVTDGIGIWFDRVHMEHREAILSGGSGVNGTFIQAINCEVHMENVEASQVEWLAETRGYGKLFLSNCGRSGGIAHIGNGQNFTWYIGAGTELSKAVIPDSVVIKADKAAFGHTTWSHPSGRSVLSDCQFGNLSITNDGEVPDVSLYNPIITGDCIITTSNTRIFGGRTQGAMTFVTRNGNGVLDRHDVWGPATVEVRYGTHYTLGPLKFKEIYYAGPPSEIGGVPFPVNSRWYDTTAVNTGDNYEYLKTTTGWKAVSKIQ